MDNKSLVVRGTLDLHSGEDLFGAFSGLPAVFVVLKDCADNHQLIDHFLAEFEGGGLLDPMDVEYVRKVEEVSYLQLLGHD